MPYTGLGFGYVKNEAGPQISRSFSHRKKPAKHSKILVLSGFFAYET